MCRHDFVWTEARRRRGSDPGRPVEMWFQCGECGERDGYWCQLKKKWFRRARPEVGSRTRYIWA
jgi:hypothetical protein